MKEKLFRNCAFTMLLVFIHVVSYSQNNFYMFVTHDSAITNVTPHDTTIKITFTNPEISAVTDSYRICTFQKRILDVWPTYMEYWKLRCFGAELPEKLINRFPELFISYTIDDFTGPGIDKGCDPSTSVGVHLVNRIKRKVLNEAYYDISGRKINQLANDGTLYITRTIYEDGTIEYVKKIANR